MNRPSVLIPAVIAAIRDAHATHGPMSAAAMAATLAEAGIEIHPETARRGMRMVGIAPVKVMPPRPAHVPHGSAN